MNEVSQFFFPPLKRPRSPDLGEFEYFIELIPVACLLIDERTGRVLSANAHAAEFTLFTKNELTGSDTSTLWLIDSERDTPVTQAAIPINNPVEYSEHYGTLTRRDLTHLPVKIQSVHIPGREPRSLIVLTPDTEHSIRGKQTITQDFLLEVRNLVDALTMDDEDSSIEQIIQSAGQISGADLLAVYHLMPDQPLLQRYATMGSPDLLPERLTAHDLTYLLKPQLWIKSKRPSCNLHRAALNAGLLYLASTPIGRPQALNGLLVMGSSKKPPVDSVLQVAQLAATNLSITIQHSNQKTAYQARVKQLTNRLQAGSALLEHTNEGVLILDPDLKVIHSNLAVETMLGYTEREMAGQPVRKLLIGTESISSALEAARQGSATHNLGNERIYRRDGQSFLSQIRIFPVHDSEHLEGILVFIQDLSEQERIRVQSQHMEGQAVLGEIIAVFAHEVRNPINNISTGLQLMAYNLPETDPGQESIQRMLQDCDRLEELIKSVLAFSRPMEYEMEILELGALLSRQLERMRSRIQNLNIHCDLQINPDCPRIWGNPHALEQVFNNLIGNALQAMSEGGGSLNIRIAPNRTVEGRSYAEVSITDTGPGIPFEHQERIFLPFFTTKRNGTGLGLPIAKRIVTAHKGTIHVTSFPGGTVFKVQFPAVNS